MTSPLLAVKNLHVVFGDRAVIHNLSFEAQPGQSLAVIGPNGAGKTVLLKALLGLIPYAGMIRWRPDARLGYVPQKIEADRQLPLRLRDFLAAKAAVLKLPFGELDRVSSEVGLTQDALDASIGHLSGGQFQKALIAFALMGQPNVLLFDEPTASLDELAEERVYDMLHALQRDKGMTLILVSHDLSVVYRYADMVLCLSKGTPCMGPPREVLTPETLEHLYAAPPKYYRHVDDAGAGARKSQE
ncbi:MAG TPA: metal ABC transporter ATP-binding protein [Candidatus Baltobacteraceae bacterium]|nr:metal ABC transporter ATP-binding protein [Candidatus Baltobacteraceae bacterium]